MTTKDDGRAGHTPLPWRLFVNEQGAFEIGAGRPGEMFLAGRNPWPHNAAESIANAHLFFAAPDLLAAVKYVLDHIADPERNPRDLYPTFGLDASRAIEMCRAAIAKAKATGSAS